MTQTLDLGHGRNEVRRRRRDWREAELDRRAHVRFGHSYDPRKAPARAFVVRRLLERDVVPAQPSLQCVGRRVVFQHDCHRPEARNRSLVQHDRAIVRAAPEHGRPVHQVANRLQANDVLVEATRTLEVANVQFDAPESLIPDHAAPYFFGGNVRRPRRRFYPVCAGMAGDYPLCAGRRGAVQIRASPPSMKRSVLAMKLASSEARKTAALAISPRIARPGRAERRRPCSRTFTRMPASLRLSRNSCRRLLPRRRGAFPALSSECRVCWLGSRNA